MSGVFVAKAVYNMLKIEGHVLACEMKRNCVVPVDGKGRATYRTQNNHNPVTTRSPL